MLEKLLGISSALAETTAAVNPEEMSPAAAILQMVLIRPQKKKDKKVKEMLDSLKHGDRVTTIGGIYGTIVGIKEDTITLAIGQKNAQPTEMTVARWAIRNVEEVTIENDSEVLN